MISLLLAALKLATTRVITTYLHPGPSNGRHALGKPGVHRHPSRLRKAAVRRSQWHGNVYTVRTVLWFAQLAPL